jgi:hypothetical protein
MGLTTLDIAYTYIPHTKNSSMQEEYVEPVLYLRMEERTTEAYTT